MDSLIVAAESEAGSGLSTSAAVWFGLLSVVVLAVLHLAAPHIRRLPFVPESATTSFAGRLAVSYVFLHLLPELNEGNSELGEVLGDAGPQSALLGLEIFLVALVGFVVFFALERLAEKSQKAAPDEGTPVPARAAARCRWRAPARRTSSACTSHRSWSTTGSSPVPCR
jgi:drug/metabolite transporter (DMT)-like permease